MPRLLAAPFAALAWLGRQGTRAVAVSIFLGVALPQLAASLKPYFTPTIFVLLVLAFLRVDPVALGGYFRRPKLIVAATAWIMVIAPAIFGVLFGVAGVRESSPALFLALVFQASAAPIMSSPAFAALIGLDAALSLATLMACVAVTPLTAPLFTYLFADASFSLAPVPLGLKLFGLLAGSAVVATLIRRAMGGAWVAAQRERIDGLNVVTLTIFAIAIMDGVAAAAWTRPWFVMALIALTFGFAIASMALTVLIFRFAGQEKAWAIGWSAANRNMGLMLAATGTALPETTWLYMGLAQFPIYLLPLMLQPLVRRVMAK